MDELKLYVYAYMIPSAFILSWATSFFILRVLPRLSAHGIIERGNIPRAEELIGDIGTYSIGALIAISAIIGPWNN